MFERQEIMLTTVSKVVTVVTYFPFVYDESVVSMESVLLTKHDRMGTVAGVVAFSRGNDIERFVCACARRAGGGRNSDLAGS